jgi:hypothetical protein
VDGGGGGGGKRWEGEGRTKWCMVGEFRDGWMDGWTVFLDKTACFSN